ncbi:MAG TPA: FecR family protein [Verrucomicrobiae bacterium]|nr:FecR family protein [Verrucomicrobiae bacterium]
MKKLVIGCLVALVLFIVACVAAWFFIAPHIGGWVQNAVDQAKQQAMKQAGLGGLGSATGTAYLTDIKGDVYVTHEGKREGASQGPVAEGDVIETEADGSASLIWPDYGRTLIDKNAKLEVSSADKQGDNLNVHLKLDGGRIWTRLERLLSPSSNFDVRSSNVVATVRGTSFGVDARDASAVSIQVAESKVGVQKMASADSNNAVGEMVVTAGQQASVNEDVKAAMPKAAAMTESAMNDPFVLEGNTKIDPALMSWVSKAMELYNSIPQGRSMTPDEEQQLEQKALDLWNSLPDQYKNGETLDEAEQNYQSGGAVLNTSATIMIK